MQQEITPPEGDHKLGKFEDALVTADGSQRAEVALTHPETLWFNTGTLCNIACVNCYIDSSPTNDQLSYLTLAEVEDYLDQLDTRGWGVSEIGFTGGEPFMNPEFLPMLNAALGRGYRVLVLTNAMRPMQRKRIQVELEDIIANHGEKLTFRVSMDHFTEPLHDDIRGAGSFASTLDGLAWLRDRGANLAIACRLFDGDEAAMRSGFADMFDRLGLSVDANDPAALVLFPEMDETADVPEITTACWGILDKHPDQVMCSSSRMVVRHRGADRPSVIACTLLPYAKGFDLGATLEEAEAPVRLNHPHCARFCVLGGASCSG